MANFCANFSLPRPLCSRLRPDERDRQTSDTHHRLMPLPYGGGIVDNSHFCTLIDSMFQIFAADMANLLRYNQRGYDEEVNKTCLQDARVNFFSLTELYVSMIGHLRPGTQLSLRNRAAHLCNMCLIPDPGSCPCEFGRSRTTSKGMWA